MGRGSDFIIQMHFHPTGKVERERATVGIYFADRAPERRLREIQLPGLFGIGTGLEIPPGEKQYVIQSSATMPVDVRVYTANPHAHYLGKEIKADATLPDGTTRPLLWIQDWDFNWQDGYTYKEPVVLPRGTRVDVRITYDNSADNPRNPSNPPTRVWWGEQSTDEMGSVGFLLVPVRREDEPAWNQFAALHQKLTIAAAGKTGTLQRVALSQANAVLDAAAAVPASGAAAASIASGTLAPQIVRDLFDGIGGNADALKRGFDATSQIIAGNPNHAEALAWHGAATLFQSSTSANLSALERIGFFQRGTKEMDSAVGLAPDNPSVRMARGTVLRILTPGMPRLGNVPGLIENARLDYQRLFDLQSDRLASLGTHRLGELLQGLGELNSRQGKTADAEKYYGMIQTMLQGTEYAARAAEWMQTKQPLPVARTACVSCHATP